jgi:hypothetical protein
MRVLHLLALASFAVFSAHDVRAASKTVSLGEVSVVGRSDGVLNPKIVSLTEDELGRLDLSGARRQAILSLSVTQLDTQARPGGASSLCVVSLALRNPRSGAIFAVVEGRARAEGAQRLPLESSVLRGAVHGAVARIPDALR